MDWPEYKALAQRPDVLPRALLTRTEALLPAPLAPALRAARRTAPLPKPADHKGGAETDLFEVALCAAAAEAIAAAVAAAARAGAVGPGVVAAWRELRDHIVAGQDAGDRSAGDGSGA